MLIIVLFTLYYCFVTAF